MNLQRKLLGIILIGLIIQGFAAALDVTCVFGELSITLKWRVNAGTGSTWLGPLAADLNNDGLMEIVITGMNGIAALNPLNGNVIWRQPYGGDHVPCEIIDLNKDGIPEILMGPQYINGSSGGVLALHGNNGSVYWYNPQAACKGTYIAVADINADGYPEIYSATPGRVTALTYDGRIFASTYTYYPCWGGMSVGDTDFDGVFEVYLGERSNTYPPPSSPGRGLRAFWADNLTERWAHPDLLCSSQAPVLADVDKDGDLEIIVMQQGGGGIAVINTDGSVNTYNDIYRKGKIPGTTRGHQGLTVADVDDDGNLEAIQCGNADHEAFPPEIIDLVDWKLDAKLPFPSVDPPAVADIDGDGKLELIATNAKNVTIFKYNPEHPANYDTIYTIPLANAQSFSIAQDIDGDGKLELVFDQYNSYISVYDVDPTPAPTPLPRSGRYFYSEYRTREPVYVPPPDQPPKISKISPSDGATSVPTTLSQLSFKLVDTQGDLMNYTVTTNPDIGSANGINVPSGTIITVPVSGLSPSTTYTWTVTVTDGTHTTKRTFTFYTEGNVTLTVNIYPEGSGSVIKNPDNEGGVYAYGTRVKLTAVADNIVYTFSSWGGNLGWMGSNNPATIIMDGNKKVIAKFTKIEYTLTINVSPTGSGSVNVNKTKPYYYDDVVKLTAVPNAGWSFSHWTGDLTGNNNPVELVINGNKKVTAVFVEVPAVQYQLTISVTGMGTTDPTAGSYMYGEGTVVSVTATPDSGWIFDHWVLDSISVGSDNPINVTMNSNRTLEAVFMEIPPPPQYELVISVSGNGTTNPIPGTYLHDAGTEVEITAFPDNGWTLDHWILDGVNVGSTNPYNVTLNSNHTLIAVFTKVIPPKQYQLTISVSGNGTTDPAEGSYVYDEGTVVNITAYSAKGWTLDYWLLDGETAGNANPFIIIMDKNHTLTAVFFQEQYILTINISPEGSGYITKIPEQSTYTYGTSVQLTASASEGWSFSHWSGSINSSDNPITFTITGNMTITAHFTRQQYTIVALVNGVGGTIDPSGTVTVTYGEDITFTITPYNGYHIFDVLVDNASQGPISMYTFHAVNMNHSITAFFAPNEYTLTVNVYPEGSGTITINNTGPYHYGDTVLLEAVPADGWYFACWSGDLTGSANPATITVDGNKTITANFTRVIFQSGYETGDFSEWTGTSATSGDSITVVSIDPHHGTYHAQASMSAVSRNVRYAYAYKNVDLSEFYVRFYFKLKDNLPFTTSSDQLMLIYARAGTTAVFQAGFGATTGYLSGNYRSGTTWTSWYATSIRAELDVWHCIEIYWKKDTSNGVFRVYYDGVMVFERTGIDTSRYGNITEIRLGCTRYYFASAQPLRVFTDCVVVAYTYIEPEAKASNINNSDSQQKISLAYLSPITLLAAVPVSLNIHGRKKRKNK